MKNTARHSFPNKPFDWTKRSASAVATGGSSLQGIPRPCSLYLSASARVINPTKNRFFVAQLRKSD
jgi:hypothetical protein